MICNIWKFLQPIFLQECSPNILGLFKNVPFGQGLENLGYFV